MISRRSFLGGLIAAPAVVQFANLMPVRGIIMPIEQNYTAVIVDMEGNVLGRTSGCIVAEIVERGVMKISEAQGEIFRSGMADAVQLEKNGKPWLGVTSPLKFTRNIVHGNSFTLADFDIKLGG